MREHVGVDRRVDRVLHLGGVRPDVLEVDVVPVGVGAEWVALEVEVHRAGESVRDDERRTRQVVHLDVRVDPTLEIPVAGEHGSDGEVVFLNRRGDLFDDWTGVSDARRAAVAHRVEAEVLEVGSESGLLVIVGDHLGAGRQRRLDPRLRLQTLLARVAGEEPGREHDRRVGRVGAGGDGGDRDGAVVEGELPSVLQGHWRRL